MKTWWLRFFMAAVCGMAISAQAESSIGLGAQYYQAMDSLEKPFSEDGFAPVISFRTDLGSMFGLQVDGVYYSDEGYAGSLKETFSPQAFLLLGRGLYAGAGIGTLISDGEFADNPLFVGRVGVNLEWFPGVHLDLNASYEWADWDGINVLNERVDSDTVTVGATLRFLL